MALQDLYREVILDHYRNPRNRGTLVEPDVHTEGHNPLCGDQVFLDLAFDEAGHITDIAVSGQGCSISQASASMMTAAVKGQGDETARALIEAVKRLLNVKDADGQGPPLGDIEALAGVKKFPARVKCAALSWNTLAEGLDRHARGEAHGTFTER